MPQHAFRTPAKFAGRRRWLAALAGLAGCATLGVGIHAATGIYDSHPISDAASIHDQSPGRQASAPRFGINLSGAEARGGDAIRPTLADLKNAIDRQGFELIRYPFKRDRMTPERIRDLKALTDYARSRGVPVILDNHSFNWPPVDQQVEWWTQFARHFPDDGTILLDLNNEPKGVEWARWGIEAKQVIAGLRANGIRHPILLEWPGYSSITRFDKQEPKSKTCESAACALDRAPGELDPIRRTFLNGHRYFDADGSGTKGACIRRGGIVRTSSGFASFAGQLRKRGWQGYITESAFGSHRGIPKSCEAVGNDAITAIQENGDVLKGITWWGAGRIWPDRYPFKIDCPKAQRFSCPLSDYVMALRGSSDARRTDF